LVITDDKTVVITDITNEVAPEGKTFTTYNFEVADTHTYFVLQEGKVDGSFAVWVHNIGACKISYDKAGKNITRVKATIYKSDLGMGTGTTQAARDLFKKAGKKYEVGHIIGKLLGGGGKNSENVFAQLRKLNRGEYRKFEKFVAKKVRELGKVKIDIKLLNRNKLGVPKEIIYKVKGKGVNRTESFENIK